MSECPCVVTSAPIPEQIICRKFIEIPREFIDIYRIFQGLLFAYCASRASSGRRPDSCGQHLLKNQRQTGGLSSIHHRRENPRRQMRSDAPSSRWGRVRSEPGRRNGPNKAERRRGGFSTARIREELTRPMKISSDREGRNCFADRGGVPQGQTSVPVRGRGLWDNPRGGAVPAKTVHRSWSPLSSFETTPRRTRKGIGVAYMRRVSGSVSGLPRLSGRARRRPFRSP